jgi:hypothetical protein
MSLLHILEVYNTQDKIWNDVRRTYIGESDLKEGELICKKCEGSGSQPKHKKLSDASFLRCTKCGGRGIVDWAQNAVNRPIVFGRDSSSSSSLSSWSPKNDPKYDKLRGMIQNSANQMKLQAKSRFLKNIRVTKYKRRKIV